MKRAAPVTALGLATALPAAAHGLGFAGLLSKSNKEDLPPIMLSVGKPIAEAPLMPKSGAACELEINSDGTGEPGLEGANFLRAIWINGIVISKLEIRPYGIESVEFDDEGTMEIEFIAIRPGPYVLRQPGSTGEGQRMTIAIQQR
ncbi:MAG: hypothetical protein LJE68_07330 [Rhodobacter sp.]|nr:hypothetical protein [Rhodobacter sp.]